MTTLAVIRIQNIDLTKSLSGHGAERSCFSLLLELLYRLLD